jgi:hypothetical protein
MMGRKHREQANFFYEFRLDDMIPKGHLYQVSEWVTRWGDSRIGCGLIQDGKHWEVCHDGCDFVAG